MRETSKGAGRRDAGAGAAAQATAAAERAQRYRDKAEAAERQERAWRAGSDGERLVADRLALAGWPVLHDQPWPGRPRANIDHLAFSPSRLWLIDAKHWSGDVAVTDGVLRQNGYSRRMAVEKARTAAADVANRLGGTAPSVSPVLCMTQAASDLPPTLVDGVLVVGLQHLDAGLGPAPLLDVELARLMERTPALLRGDALAMATPIVGNSSSPVRSAPAAYLKERKAARTGVPQPEPHTPLPARPAPERPRRARSKKDPSFARLLLGLLVVAVSLWLMTNVATVAALVQPLMQWWVSSVMPG